VFDAVDFGLSDFSHHATLANDERAFGHEHAFRHRRVGRDDRVSPDTRAG
jgi:hypothetical protein